MTVNSSFLSVKASRFTNVYWWISWKLPNATILAGDEMLSTFLGQDFLSKYCPEKVYSRGQCVKRSTLVTMMFITASRETTLLQGNKSFRAQDVLSPPPPLPVPQVVSTKVVSHLFSPWSFRPHTLVVLPPIHPPPKSFHPPVPSPFVLL